MWCKLGNLEGKESVLCYLAGVDENKEDSILREDRLQTLISCGNVVLETLARNALKSLQLDGLLNSIEIKSLGGKLCSCWSGFKLAWNTFLITIMWKGLKFLLGLIQHRWSMGLLAHRTPPTRRTKQMEVSQERRRKSNTARLVSDYIDEVKLLYKVIWGIMPMK
ncbi:hypothetical protein Tco_0725085 [Tanacetum coccineum]|uniref:Uncharacterized protein n=1 Tax=Tanacetum coccineum TaxID=301880 RepID=A0ABQ4YBU9_9ASTR